MDLDRIEKQAKEGYSDPKETLELIKKIRELERRQSEDDINESVSYALRDIGCDGSLK